MSESVANSNAPSVAAASGYVVNAQTATITGETTDFVADIGGAADAGGAVANLANVANATTINGDEQVPLAVIDEDDETQREYVDLADIEDDEVAKFGDLKEPGKWFSHTLPIIGSIAGFFAATKLKREESKEKR
jgi:hypothetical protein